MDFGLDKIPNIILQKGYLFHSQNIILDFYRQNITAWTEKMDYLVTEESEGVEH